MILEVITWPRSQEVMEKDDWFFVDGKNIEPSSYAKDITKRFERLQESEEYLVELLDKRQLEQYIDWLDENE
jgi:hypothetical protein